MPEKEESLKTSKEKIARAYMMHPKKKLATSRRGSKIWDLSDARQLLTDRFRGRSSVPLSAGRSCGKMGPLGGAAVTCYFCWCLLLLHSTTITSTGAGAGAHLLACATVVVCSLDTVYCCKTCSFWRSSHIGLHMIDAFCGGGALDGGDLVPECVCVCVFCAHMHAQ